MKKLKKSMFFLLALLLLSGCVEEGNALKNSTEAVEKIEAVKPPKPQRPSYLQVYQAYTRTKLDNQCEAYGAKIMELEHEEYGVYPYTVDEDMDIIKSHQTDTAYVYDVKCQITARYQVNAFAYTYKDFEKPLGRVTIKK